MARKTKEEAERTYHALLDAATDLFMQKGIAKTTLNDIATAAGMTRGAVYWHFDNKDSVIMALWQRNAATLHQTFRSAFENLDGDDPVHQFRKTLMDLVAGVVHEPQLGAAIRIVMHSVEITDEQTELQRFLLQKRDELHQSIESAFAILRWERLLKVNATTEQLTHALMSYLHGLLHNHLKPGKRILDLEQDGEVLLNLFLDSVLKDHAEIDVLP